MMTIDDDVALCVTLQQLALKSAAGKRVGGKKKFENNVRKQAKINYSVGLLISLAFICITYNNWCLAFRRFNMFSLLG